MDDLIRCDICAIDIPVYEENPGGVFEGNELTFSLLDIKPIGYQKVPVAHYIGDRNVSHEEWIDSHKKKRKEPPVRQLPYYRRYDTKLY